MADVANPPKDDGGSPQFPRTVSALRSSRSGRPRRVNTRVSIAEPDKNDPSPSPDPVPSSGSTSASSSVPQSHDKTGTSTPFSKKLILTLDGGGIRGYSSLIILRALMNEIADIEQTLEPHAASSAHTDRIPVNQIPDNVLRKGQYLPCHYFDYIAGTSVGGLIAIMLGMLGKSADECIAEFHQQNRSIPLTNNLPGVTIDLPLLYRRSTWPTKRTRSFFDTFANFSATSTAQTLPSAHRESTTTSTTTSTSVDRMVSSSALSSASTASATAEFKKDIFQCQTLAWCTEVEDGPHSKSRRIPYAFCSYKEDIDGGDGPDNTVHNPAHCRVHTTTTTTSSSGSSMVSIPEVAKAITTPSSSSFKPFKLGGGQFVDGSKQIRDPTLEVLKEMSSLLRKLDVDDGETIPPITTTTGKKQRDPPIDLILSLGTDEHHAWFYEKLRRPVLERDHSTWRDKIHLQEGQSYREYHRFEMKDVKLGLRKKYYLSQIEDATMCYLAENEEVRGDIRRYAEFLVERRRARASTSQWETFALGVKYSCHLCDDEGDGCTSVMAVESRQDFVRHMVKQHDLFGERTRGDPVAIEAELDKGRVFGCS